MLFFSEECSQNLPEFAARRSTNLGHQAQEFGNDRQMLHQRCFGLIDRQGRKQSSSFGSSGNALFTNASINHRFFQTNSIQVIRAVLLLFGYKYDLFSAENKDGKKPIQSTFSQQIVKCIKIMEKNYKSGSNSWSATTPKKEAANNCGDGTKTAISKKPGHILLSLDGGGIRGLVLVRVSSFSANFNNLNISQFLQILMHIERKLGTKLWWELLHKNLLFDFGNFSGILSIGRPAHQLEAFWHWRWLKVVFGWDFQNIFNKQNNFQEIHSRTARSSICGWRTKHLRESRLMTIEFWRNYLQKRWAWIFWRQSKGPGEFIFT